MSELGRTSFELDLATLGQTELRDWTEADRARVQRLRALDAGFLRAHPNFQSLPPPRPTPRPRSWALAPLGLAATALMTLVVLYQAPEPGTRSKGQSAVTLFVKRDGAVDEYKGSDLMSGDTLVFRYTTQRRWLVLAGIEDSGRATIYTNTAIQPGAERLLPSGVELDGYVGTELVVAIFSDEPVDSAAIRERLARVSIPLARGAEPRVDLAIDVPYDQAAWQIRKKGQP